MSERLKVIIHPMNGVEGNIGCVATGGSQGPVECKFLIEESQPGKEVATGFKCALALYAMGRINKYRLSKPAKMDNRVGPSEVRECVNGITNEAVHTQWKLYHL